MANSLVTGTTGASVQGVSVDQVVSGFGISPLSVKVENSQPEVAVAYVSADGNWPHQSARVSGGGLHWYLAGRSDEQLGDAEVWWAATDGVDFSVTAFSRQRGLNTELTVVTYAGAGGIGAVATGSGPTGAPSVVVDPQATGSLVGAVGFDWTESDVPVPGAGQVIDAQDTDSARDTYWAQHATALTASGTSVTINDISPTTDQWDMTAVEVIPDVTVGADDPTTPTSSGSSNLTTSTTDPPSTTTSTTDPPTTTTSTTDPPTTTTSTTDPASTTTSTTDPPSTTTSTTDPPSSDSSGPCRFCSYYSGFANGTPASQSFFPISVWLQDPAQTTQIESGYANLADAAAAEGINEFYGLYEWPSSFGTDNSSAQGSGLMQAACNAGEYVVAGGDPSSNTDATSVASADAVAASEKQAGTGISCSKFLIGYQWADEPPECTTNVSAQVAAIHADDPTREAYDNQASWVTWNQSGCETTADAVFSAPDITSSDDYHNLDAWNHGACAAGNDVSTSPYNDCEWLYGYQAGVQEAIEPNKPTLEFIDAGNDALGFAEQNGSSCDTTTDACTNGNEYNSTAPQVNSSAWGAIINGAAGIEWFCHGTADNQSLSDSDCMGGSGSGSDAIFSNLQSIDKTIEGFAPELTTTSDGFCTMQPVDYSAALATSCTNGNLRISTSVASEPIMGMTKQVDGNEYLFVEADRANGETEGTYTIAGEAGGTATLVYDSAQKYDPAVSEQGDTFTLNSSGQFSDSLRGDNGQAAYSTGVGANSYEVKVYEISGGS